VPGDELYRRNLDAQHRQWKRSYDPICDIEANLARIDELAAQLDALRNGGQHQLFPAKDPMQHTDAKEGGRR